MPTEAAQVLDQVTPQAPAQSGVAPVKVETPAPQAAPPDVSTKLEMLLKREQAAMERERLAEQRERDVEAKLSKFADFDSVKASPKKALEMLGLSYDELTQSMLQDGAIPPEAQIRKLDEKFEQFKTEQVKAEEQRLLDEKKNAEANEQKIISDFKGQITQYIKDNAQRYELTQFEEQQDLVFAVIDEQYTRTLDPATGIGKIMSIQEAADKVELFLEQKETKRKELNKIKTIWGVLPHQAQRNVQSQAPRPKTLTNSLTATQAAPVKRAPISDEERVQRAIAYARGLRPDLR
jgi:hypothetical protein